MYITKELHDAICEAGAWAFGIILGAALLVLILSNFRIMWDLLWIDILYAVQGAKEKRRRRVAIRRYKAAMKVFDKPMYSEYHKIERIERRKK